MSKRGAEHAEFSEGNRLYGEVFDRLFDHVLIESLPGHGGAAIRQEGRREREEVTHLLVGDEGYSQIKANRLIRGVIENAQGIIGELESLTPEDFL